MKMNEISGKNDKELKELLNEKRDALTNLKLDNKQNKLKNTRSIFNMRKDISKILTVIRERELAVKDAGKEEK